jgi:hypothetical protein
MSFPDDWVFSILLIFVVGIVYNSVIIICREIEMELLSLLVHQMQD